MGKALEAYRRYRELAERGEFSRIGEVLDENWIENCLGLTGGRSAWTSRWPTCRPASARPSPTCRSPSMT